MTECSMKDFYKNKKVLITGHTGFKGAWLAQILHLWGAKVIGVSLRPHTKPNLFSILKLDKNIKNYFVDIRDFKKIKNIFAREKPEVVIHLAAQALVRKSYDEPLLTHSTNILGTANILECVRASKSVKSSVIITTDKVYTPINLNGLSSSIRGTPFFKEEDPLGASDPYGSSKAAADIVAQSYIKQGVRAGIARAGNVIGGGDWGADRLIVDLARSIYEHKKPCKIRNPGSIRPWQHVLEPLAGYLILALEIYNGNEKAIGVWNFGPYEKAHLNVGALADMSIKLAKAGSYEIIADISKPETAVLQLDPTKARNNIKWLPKLELEEALKITFDWYEKFYAKKTDMVEYSNRQIEGYFGNNCK